MSKQESEQGFLFEPAAPGAYGTPYARDSPTSRDAAERIEPSADTLRRMVLDHVRGCQGGATCDEVEEKLGLRHQTASARLWELHKAGLVVDSGRTRKTRSGRSAVVWVGAAELAR